MHVARQDAEGLVYVSLAQLMALEFSTRALSFVGRQPRGSLLSGSHASRLRGRGLDDEPTIARRLVNARSEILQARWYDSVIVNDNLDQAYDCLRAVYVTASLAPGRNPQLLDEILAR